MSLASTRPPDWAGSVLNHTALHSRIPCTVEGGVNHDPWAGRRVGEAPYPGPSTPSIADNIAATLAIQKLEAQLDQVHLAPSGLRDAAIEIISEAIDEIHAGDHKAYDTHLRSAGEKWSKKLATWYPGFEDIHPVDQRKCVEAYLRCDWHAVNGIVIKLIAHQAIRPQGTTAPPDQPMARSRSRSPARTSQKPASSAFDDIDAELHDEEEHFALMEPPTEDDEMPELAQGRNADEGKNEQTNGTIIPRWDVGLDEDQRTAWAEAEKSLKCYLHQLPAWPFELRLFAP